MQLLSTVFLSGGSIIDLDGTFVIQLVIFFVAMLVLRSLVFKPVVALFDAREEAIDGARVDARRMEKEAGDKAVTFDEEMRTVRIEAGQERDRLRTEGQRLERQVLDKVRTETQETLRSADKKMRAEADKARSEIKVTVPALARDIAARLLGREVSS